MVHLFGGGGASSRAGSRSTPRSTPGSWAIPARIRRLFPPAGGPSLAPSAQLGQNVFVARLHGTPGNGGGGGGGTGTCTACATCLAEVQASLPNPAAAPDAKSRKVANGLQNLLAKAGKGIDGAASATKPKQQAKKLSKARKALEKLLTKAGKADEKPRLNAPLATIQAAVDAVLAQL